MDMEPSESPSKSIRVLLLLPSLSLTRLETQLREHSLDYLTAARVEAGPEFWPLT